MMRTTKVLIAVPNRPADSHKESVNMLAIVLQPGAKLVSEPNLLVCNQGMENWGPIGQFPNTSAKQLDPEATADGLLIVGYLVNNSDENLARFVEATFNWEGPGPDVAQTSVENKHWNSPPYGEGVSVAFSVPKGTPPIPIAESFAENFPTLPFSANIPGQLTVTHGGPLSFPPGFKALTQTLALMNGHGVSHRFVRLTASITG